VLVFPLAAALAYLSEHTVLAEDSTAEAECIAAEEENKSNHRRQGFSSPDRYRLPVLLPLKHHKVKRFVHLTKG
jgi:hypothetical protein